MTTGPAMTTTVAGAASGKVMQVTIADFKFAPESLTIPVGTKVIWTNNDSVSHTVTGDDTGSPLKSDLIPQGKTFEYTFSKAGTYAYHCTPHPFMKATIIVTP
jgi:amicyanin